MVPGGVGTIDSSCRRSPTFVVACFHSRRHGGALVANGLDAFLRLRLKTLGVIHM